MSKIVCYVPTYSPETEAQTSRPYNRLSQEEISERLKTKDGRIKPGMYFDAIDSIINIRPDIKLVVGDGRSTDSIRDGLQQHNASGGYELKLYPEKMSQWAIFNDIFEENKDADYFVYSSSDVIWTMDWVAEAIKEFERNPKLQILFPLVSQGDTNIPCQVAAAPRDQNPLRPPYDQFGKAPVLNAYAMIFRMDFLCEYGGYPTRWRNCFTESFLHLMCEAMDGEMRLLPRGWVWHWSLGDAWKDSGGHYNFDADRPLFDEVIIKVQMVQAAGFMSPEFLKKLLYV